MALPKSETRVLGTRYITIIPTYLYNVSLLKLPRWPSLKPLKKEIIEALVCHTWMNICCLDYPQIHELDYRIMAKSSVKPNF